ASLAARALCSCTADELDRLLEGGPLPRLRARLGQLAENLRYEEAARLRDRIEALEQVVERLRRLERPRGLGLCLIPPAAKPGWRKAFFVCAGRACATRSLPPGAGARLEINAGLTLCRLARENAAERLTLTEAEDLLVLDGFARRPQPELAVLPLDAGQITAHLERIENPRAA